MIDRRKFIALSAAAATAVAMPVIATAEDLARVSSPQRVNLTVLRLWTDNGAEFIEYETNVGGVYNWTEARVADLLAVGPGQDDPDNWVAQGAKERARVVAEQVQALRSSGRTIPRSAQRSFFNLKSAVTRQEAQLAYWNYRSPSRALRRLAKNAHRLPS